MNARRIAVLDIGKTHARLLLVDGPGGGILWRSERDSRGIQGPLTRELDVAGTEAWLLDALAQMPGRDQVDAIVPVAHGAAAVLLDAHHAPLAAPDYEDPVFDAIADEYRALRDPFQATYSPFLPLGLNLARQWFFLQRRDPALFARVRTALLYPQYWAWRLSDVAASEVTSLGCHTDLWLPAQAQPSALARRQGWTPLLPALRRAGDELGTVTAGIAARTGLPSRCRVLCGIHDSNASFLCHLVAERAHPAFAVVSSGTWTVLFARGAALQQLDESRDMLANVDALGTPVPTARFMGGREYGAIAGEDGLRASPQWRDVQRLLDEAVVALPSFAEGGGPFPPRSGRIVSPRTLSAAERAALASLYVALMCAWRLDELGARGPLLLDGPLAHNPLVPALLAALRPAQPLRVSVASAGAAEAARILCGFSAASRAAHVTPAPVDAAALHRYTQRWRDDCSRIR